MSVFQTIDEIPLPVSGCVTIQTKNIFNQRHWLNVERNSKIISVIVNVSQPLFVKGFVRWITSIHSMCLVRSRGQVIHTPPQMNTTMSKFTFIQIDVNRSCVPQRYVRLVFKFQTDDNMSLLIHKRTSTRFPSGMQQKYRTLISFDFSQTAIGQTKALGQTKGMTEINTFCFLKSKQLSKRKSRTCSA